MRRAATGPAARWRTSTDLRRWPGQARTATIEQRRWTTTETKTSAEAKNAPPADPREERFLVMAEAAGFEPAMGDKPKPA